MWESVQSASDMVISSSFYFFVFSSSCFEKILTCPKGALSQTQPLSYS